MTHEQRKKKCTVKQVLLDPTRAISYAHVSIMFCSCGKKILKTFAHVSHSISKIDQKVIQHYYFLVIKFKPSVTLVNYMSNGVAQVTMTY